MDYEDRIEQCLDVTFEGDWQMVNWKDTKKNLVELARKIYQEGFKEGFLSSGEGHNGEYTSKFGTVFWDENEKRKEVADYAWESYLREKETQT